MAKLYFRYGAMNSGKSTALLQAAYNYEERSQHVSLAKPAIDTKGVSNIVSRLGVVRAVDFVISPDASEEPENMIMERYVRRLEESVRRDPSLYLWSHNRWKFKKPANYNDTKQN